MPLFAAAVSTFAGRALLGDTSYLPLLVVPLFAIATATQLATVAVTPSVRAAVRGFLLARVQQATSR